MLKHDADAEEDVGGGEEGQNRARTSLRHVSASEPAGWYS